MLILFLLLPLLTSAPTVDAERVKVCLNGNTHITVAGQEESRDEMVLNVKIDGNTAEISMLNFEILGFKGLSFEGKLSLDEHGNITGFSNTKISGFSPISVKTITGTLTESEANILVQGKAALFFTYTISYQGTVQK